MSRKWLKWIRGRQEGSYSKLALFPQWFSLLFNVDGYLLSFPKGCSVMKHKDPVATGYAHHRLNITFKRANYRERMYILGPIKRWGCIEVFRPDLYEHGLCPISESIFMLSFGCRIKSE